MMVVTQLDQVVEVGGPAVDPMPNVMDIGELGVRAAGETASLVATPDLDALRIAGVPAGPTEIEAPAVGPVGRNQDFGVAGESPGDFP